MNKVIKAPAEIIPHTLDWTDRIPSTETISSCTATSTNLKTLVTDTSLFVSASASISAKLTTWRITGGTLNSDYKLVFTATSSTGNVYTQRQLLEVREEVI